MHVGKLAPRPREVFRTSWRDLPYRAKISLVDTIDRKILSRLQERGRLTITDLAAELALSVSACQRRVRELERSGAIRQYRAVIDPVQVGLGFEALVFVTMQQEDRASLRAFEDGVRAVPNVISAERLFGDPDYLLRVVAADLADYHLLQDECLGVLPGVQRMTSTLVMKRVVSDGSLPLEGLSIAGHRPEGRGASRSRPT